MEKYFEKFSVSFQTSLSTSNLKTVRKHVALFALSFLLQKITSCGIV